MAKKSQNGGVNKSAEIRKLYEANPNMKVKEVIAALAGMGITAGANLVYLVKGKAKGEKTRRRRVNQNVAKVATVSGNNDAVKTII